MTFGFPSVPSPGGPAASPIPVLSQKQSLEQMWFGGCGGEYDTDYFVQGQPLGTVVTGGGKAQGAKEGTRSQLSAPNATAAGRELALAAPGPWRKVPPQLMLTLKPVGIHQGARPGDTDGSVGFPDAQRRAAPGGGRAVPLGRALWLPALPLKPAVMLKGHRS